MMRTIHRDIVGAFIFSSDGKILLGHNRKGGVYQDLLVVPGGGVETGETHEEALQRETLEETGIDTSKADVTHIGVSTGKSEKTLKSGEHVLVYMTFYDFKIQLHTSPAATILKFEDDYASGEWYTADELVDKTIGPATKATLQNIAFL